MTTKQVAELLGTTDIRKSKGAFKFYRSYFYRHGMTPEHLVNKVKEKIPNAVILDSGDHWAPFNGGAKSGSAKDSYLWVTFTVPETTTTREKAMLPIGCLTNDGKLVNRP